MLDVVLCSRYAPSKKLLEHTAGVIEGQQSYVLLDSQQVVFSKVLAEVKEAAQKRTKKSVLLVRGGPGTGKSVIALHLIGQLSAQHFNVMHLTGSRAFTTNMRKLVGTRAGAQFSYFNINKTGSLPGNHFDALILDEAHRLRETSKDRFNASAWSGLSQIEALMQASKVTVCFIDDQQVVRPGEVGSSELIRQTAYQLNADFHDYELDAQFRCSGADGFINWIDNTLDISRTANVLWDKADPYEVKIVSSVEQLENEIRQKHKAGESARLVAGFCWPWSLSDTDGKLVADVRVGDWSMPWNAKPQSKRLARGILKSDFWASDPNGINPVGCVYTAQGFEFDYIGVIFGLDLRYDWDANTWVGDKNESHDSVVKRSREQFTALIKNTYRVLLTRGNKGCYIYFMDEGTRRYFQSHMEHSSLL